MSSAGGKPKTKLKFDSETEPCPTIVCTKTEFAADPEKLGAFRSLVLESRAAVCACSCPSPLPPRPCTCSDNAGNPVYVPTETVRRIKVKGFSQNSNSEKVAAAIMSKSDFLPAAAQPAIVKLLEQLKRKLVFNEGANAETIAKDGPAKPVPAAAPAGDAPESKGPTGADSREEGKVSRPKHPAPATPGADAGGASSRSSGDGSPAPATASTASGPAASRGAPHSQGHSVPQSVLATGGRKGGAGGAAGAGGKADKVATAQTAIPMSQIGRAHV